MKIPKTLGTIKVADIPPAERGRDGAAVSARPWKKLILQVFALPANVALRIEAGKDKAWLAGRFYTAAERLDGKVKTAFRRDVMFVWWVKKPGGAA